MTITEQYKRICALTNGDVTVKIHVSDGLFVVETYNLDGQGDTIEDAFASMLMHAESSALRRAEDAEANARDLRAKLSGERT